jgi:hypothetical protein
MVHQLSQATTHRPECPLLGVKRTSGEDAFLQSFCSALANLSVGAFLFFLCLLRYIAAVEKLRTFRDVERT